MLLAKLWIGLILEIEGLVTTASVMVDVLLVSIFHMGMYSYDSTKHYIYWHIHLGMGSRGNQENLQTGGPEEPRSHVTHGNAYVEFNEALHLLAYPP